MKLSLIHSAVLFLLISFCVPLLCQTDSNKIQQIGKRKFIFNNKKYLDHSIKKLIISKKKEDPLYKDIISFERKLNAAAVLGIAGSAYAIYGGISLNNSRPDLGLGKFYIAGGGLIFVLSLLKLVKYEWEINDLPAAIDIWNQNIDQDLSNIPSISFGITSNEIGLNYRF